MFLLGLSVLPPHGRSGGQVEVGCVAGLEVVPAESGDHGGVIYAESQFGQAERAAELDREVARRGAEGGVCRHAAAEDQRLCAGELCGSAQLYAQRVDDGGLEAGGQVRNLALGEVLYSSSGVGLGLGAGGLCAAPPSPAARSGGFSVARAGHAVYVVQHGGLQTAEGKV